MRLPVIPSVLVAAAGGAGASPECLTDVCVRELETDAAWEPQSLLQGALVGSELRPAEDDGGEPADAPGAALLQTSSHTSAASAQKAVLPLGFFDAEAPQAPFGAPFARELATKAVPNDVGLGPMPAYPGEEAAREASLAVEQSTPVALTQVVREEGPAAEQSIPFALKPAVPSPHPHTFFGDDDEVLYARELTEPVSLVDERASDHLTEREAKVFVAAVGERMKRDDTSQEAKRREEALAEHLMQMHLEEQANEMAEALVQGGDSRSDSATQEAVHIDSPFQVAMRQPSASSLEEMTAAQHTAALRLSGVALDISPQHFEGIGLERTETSLLGDDQLAFEEKLRGLELAQQRHLELAQAMQHLPEISEQTTQQPDWGIHTPIGGGPPITALKMGAAAAFSGEVHSCQPGGISWPECTATQAFGPEHGSCTPQCTWQCDTPRCDEVCEPQCQPPRCETRCAAAETGSCVMECDEPHCAVACSRSQCPTGDCPSCVSTCSEPMCKLRCPNTQPCRNVCEVPSCEWHCRAPEVCPQPTCHMVCESPRNCQGDTFQQLPPLSPGELSVRSFSAPAVQSGAARGTYVEGSVQHYDDQAAEGYTETPTQWPVQYIPAPAPVPVPSALPTPEPAAEPAPEPHADAVQPRHHEIGAPTAAAQEMRYSDAFTHNLVLSDARRALASSRTIGGYQPAYPGMH